MPNQNKLIDEYGWAISKITTNLIPKIQQSYPGLDMINLLMSLPVRPDFKEIDYDDVIQKVKEEKTDVDEQLLINQLSFGGYIKRDINEIDKNRILVYLVFTKDIKETWDDFFQRIFHNKKKDKILTNIAFVYLHEGMHLLNRHYDYYLNRQFYHFIEKFQKNLSDNEKADLLNIAFDYWINSYLIEEADESSEIRKFQKNPSDFIGLYDANLTHKKLTQSEIVEKLAKDAKIKSMDIRNSSGEKIGELREVEINGQKSMTVILDEQHPNEQSDGAKNQINDKDLQPIKEAMDNVRNAIIEKTRGSESQKIFENLGISYEVPIDWFQELKYSVFNVVQKYTSNYDQTWSKMKNKFRHVAKLPGKIYKEKTLNTVISIDQSGSMSNDDLRKINYVVSQLAKKSKKIYILKHDTEIASEEVFTSKNFKNLDKYITTRVSCGGTSHKAVFEKIEEIIQQQQDKNNKLIYLSFSDNYSDIEQYYSQQLFKKIIPYWIMTSGGKKLSNVAGMQISLEKGLIVA